MKNLEILILTIFCIEHHREGDEEKKITRKSEEYSRRERSRIYFLISRLIACRGCCYADKFKVLFRNNAE